MTKNPARSTRADFLILNKDPLKSKIDVNLELVATWSSKGMIIVFGSPIK